MIRISPATLHRANDARMKELAAELIGKRLVSARYAVPAGASWEGGGAPFHVHEVDIGVELATESSLVLELSWATPGRDEGLSIGLEQASQRAPSDLINLVDVSGHKEWSPILGHAVETIAVSFHVHSDDSSIRPWSFRLGTAGGHWTTIALGEVIDSGLRYMPDNLVVIFDEGMARSYHLQSSSQSAWGEVIN